MTAKKIEILLRKFKWDRLCKMYGSAHSSLIGFISTTWISQSQSHAVLDGAPSSSRGHGRRGQKNADILLCRQKKPYVIVEVESGASNYLDKIRSIEGYLRNTKEFNGVQFGLLVMTNMHGLHKGENCWDRIEDKVKKLKVAIAFVSVEKRKVKLGASLSPLDRLRHLNGYSNKSIVKIDYRVHTPTLDKRGTLYRENEK